MGAWSKKSLFVKTITPSLPVRVAGRFAFRQVRHVAGYVIHRADVEGSKLLYAWKVRMGLLDRLEVQPYRGHGTGGSVYLKGRVLEKKAIERSTITDDSVYENARNMIRRFNSSEIPGAKVRGRHFGVRAEAVADEEGFFELRFDLPENGRHHPENANGHFEWHPVDVELTDPGRARTRGWSLVPSEDSEFFVISDLDDTVLDSKVTNLFAMVATVVFGNAYTRLPFAGVVELYQALRAGSDGRRRNPLFYVSSSPWNLYDVLEDFMDYRDVPHGPIFLKDWSLGGLWNHESHKLGAIRRILETYPERQFVLIGDSGEEDPEIYSTAIFEHPGRIKAAFIRDVTGEARREEVMELARKLPPADAKMQLVRDSGEAAEIAASMNLISPENIRRVYEQLP